MLGRCRLPRAAVLSRHLTSTATDRTVSIAMSGCGWLSCFYLGVIEELKAHKYLTRSSLMAGTSGGSLSALIACADVDPKVALEFMIELSMDKTFTRNIDKGLRANLPKLLPGDTLDRVNGRLHVFTTSIYPNPQRMLEPSVISRFRDMNHLIDCVSASSFIPLYSSRDLFTRITGSPELFIDGGLAAWMPTIGDVRVAPFPRQWLMRRPPHIYIPDDGKYSLPRLLHHVFIPPSPETTRDIYNQGKKAVHIWMHSMEQKSHQK